MGTIETVLIQSFGLSTLLIATVITIVALGLLIFAYKTQKFKKDGKKLLKILFVLFVLAEFYLITDFIDHLYDHPTSGIYEIIYTCNLCFAALITIIAVRYLPLFLKITNKPLALITLFFIFLTLILDIVLDFPNIFLTDYFEMLLLAHLIIIPAPYITGLFLIVHFIIHGGKK